MSNAKPTQFAVHQQAAKLFQQYWRNLKGKYDLNSAFEKDDRLIEKSVPASEKFQNQPRSLLSQDLTIHVNKSHTVSIWWSSLFKCQ